MLILNQFKVIESAEKLFRLQGQLQALSEVSNQLELLMREEDEDV